MIVAAHKPRLLFVGAFPPAGSGVFGGNITDCRALMRSSFPGRLDLVLLDSTLISVPRPPFSIRLALAGKRCLAFVALLERRRPDAVLLFVALGASVAEKGVMAWYARLRGVPALMFPRGGGLIDVCGRSNFTRAWTRWAFRGARQVLCQEKKWQDFAVSSLGFPREDAPIVTNWTATTDLLAIGEARTPRAGGPLRILFLAWLDREKGIMELLEACARLTPGRDFVLDVAGEGNASVTARAYAAEKGLQGRVEFRGWVRGADLERALAEADVFVLPSWAEGLPNAMVEAMAAKLPVVITAVGNVPDVIEDGVSGLLIPPRDASALERALARVLDDPGLRASLAEAGHAVARERFAVEPAVDRLVSVIGKAARPGVSPGS